MSDLSVALLTSLLSGGFLLLGVVVGYYLQARSSAKSRVADAVFRVFQQLLILNGNEIFSPHHSPIDRDRLQREMDNATTIVQDIINTVASTRGFPCIQEVVTAVAGFLEVTDTYEWITNSSSECRSEIDRAIGLLEKKIDNKQFVKAFRNAFVIWSVKTMEKNGATPEEIENFTRQQKKAK